MRSREGAKNNQPFTKARYPLAIMALIRISRGANAISTTHAAFASREGREQLMPSASDSFETDVWNEIG